MKVTYKGFTGGLVKLERNLVAQSSIAVTSVTPVLQLTNTTTYVLSIYDSEKKVTHSFTDVKLEDVKFLGGAVSFGV